MEVPTGDSTFADVVSPNGWNDKTSSVKVTPGCVFLGYPHDLRKTEPSVALTGGPDLIKLTGKNYNSLSSWSCECAAGKHWGEIQKQYQTLKKFIFT